MDGEATQGACPLCFVTFPIAELYVHAESCLGITSSAAPASVMSFADDAFFPPGGIDQREDLPFSHTIVDVLEWKRLAHQPPECAFANTETVKVIIDVRSLKKRTLRNCGGIAVDPAEFLPYFLDSAKFPWHFKFARRFLLSRAKAADPWAHHKFNDREYGESFDRRSFVLGSLVLYRDQGNLLCFEQWPGDLLSAKETAEYVRQVATRLSPAIGDFCYHPMSSRQETECVPEVEKAGMRVVLSAELFGAIKYQPLTIGECVGRLRFLTAEQVEAKKARGIVIHPHDILVMDQIANDLPVCAGLITSVVQPPLCHTALLCQNRGIPNMALVGIFEKNEMEKDVVRQEEFKRLDGKFVELDVRQQSYTLLELPKVEAVAHLEEKLALSERTRRTFDLKTDISVKRMVHLSAASKLSLAEEVAVGAKAAQLHQSILAFPWKKNTRQHLLLPPACAVPFWHYNRYMESIGGNLLVKRLEALSKETSRIDLNSSDYLRAGMGDPASGRSKLVSSLRLSSKTARIESPLRDKAEDACDDLVRRMLEGEDSAGAIDSVVEKILEAISDWKNLYGSPICSEGIILRSSTNVEDLKGFSGAGLYESVAVKKSDAEDPDKIGAAVRRVYASLWKYAGFSERKIFGIKQKSAQMALLVMPYAADIVANGVAVSIIPFRSDFPGVFINVQGKDAKVTDADGQPEQIAVYDEHGGVPEIVGRSGLDGGAPILSAADAKRIFRMVMALHKRFVSKKDPDANAVDVEFVIVGAERKIQLLQCRPCNMRN